MYIIYVRLKSMGFINWQNLRKYIRRGTDAEVARIGHVNAVYDALSNGPTPPSRVVTSITADGNGPYSNDVTIDVEQRSTISTDYKLSVADTGSGFSLGVYVPYHEVIGTISFGNNIGPMGVPTLDIQVCTAGSPGDWGITLNTSSTYILNFSGDANTYRGGCLITNRIVATNISTPLDYHLVPASGFSGTDISFRFMETYISGLNINQRIVSDASNEAATFAFHLILPINN